MVKNKTTRLCRGERGEEEKEPFNVRRAGEEDERQRRGALGPKLKMRRNQFKKQRDQ